MYHNDIGTRITNRANIGATWAEEGERGGCGLNPEFWPRAFWVQYCPPPSLQHLPPQPQPLSSSNWPLPAFTFEEPPPPWWGNWCTKTACLDISARILELISNRLSSICSLVRKLNSLLSSIQLPRYWNSFAWENWKGEINGEDRENVLPCLVFGDNNMFWDENGKFCESSEYSEIKERWQGASLKVFNDNMLWLQ